MRCRLSVKIMATTSNFSASFNQSDSRRDDMQRTIETWISELIGSVDEARSSEQFQEWLRVQSQFHSYSSRNTLLITLQCPAATHVAGYHTWRTEFDRYVKKGEQAIWIWAPIITKQCPKCKNAPSYHSKIDCEYTKTKPEDWSRGLVGFKPTSVFDISQTNGKPLASLETEATGDADKLIFRVRTTVEASDIPVRIVAANEWTYGDARGVFDILRTTKVMGFLLNFV